VVLGTSLDLNPTGLFVDADGLNSLTVADEGNEDWLRFCQLQSGWSSSTFEGLVFQQVTNSPGEGITTSSVFRAAAAAGIPFVEVDEKNVETVLAEVDAPDDAKESMRNAVRAGRVVVVPVTRPPVQGWNGVAWQEVDPTTGSAGFMISGGLAGDLTIWDKIALGLSVVLTTVQVLKPVNPVLGSLAALTACAGIASTMNRAEAYWEEKMKDRDKAAAIGADTSHDEEQIAMWRTSAKAAFAGVAVCSVFSVIAPFTNPVEGIAVSGMYNVLALVIAVSFTIAEANWETIMDAWLEGTKPADFRGTPGF
jgi:hypothetical protein